MRLCSGICRVNPFDQVVTGIVFVEMFDRLTLTLPFAGTAPDRPREFFKRGRSKPKIVTPDGAKETRLLGHQPTYSSQQYRHTAGESFVSGKCAGFRHDKIGCQDIPMQISNVAERSRPGIL